MRLAVSRGVVDGGVDLVKMIPRGHGGGDEPPHVPPHLPSNFLSFAFRSLHDIPNLFFFIHHKHLSSHEGL